ARRLTRFATTRAGVAWPLAAPTGQTWIPELGEFPEIAMGDDAYSVAVAKLGGIVEVSREALNDSVFPLETALGSVLRDTLSMDLDQGIAYGEGAPEPNGIVAVATPAAAGGDLRSAVIGAWGELVAAGAAPSSVIAFVHPTVAAAEMARVGVNGQPIHGD